MRCRKRVVREISLDITGISIKQTIADTYRFQKRIVVINYAPLSEELKVEKDEEEEEE